VQDEQNETTHRLPDSLAERRALARGLVGGDYIDPDVHLLLRLCRDSDTEVRRLAIESIRYKVANCELKDALGDQRVAGVVRPILERGLDEPDAPTRLSYLSFLETCAKSRCSGLGDLAWVVPRLIAYLDDPRHEIRSACMSVLENLDRQELYQGAVLSRNIEQASIPKVKERQRVLRLVSPTVEDTELIRLYLNQSDVESKQLGLIVASLKGSFFLGDISSLAGDGETEVRLSAVRALERIGESAIPMLARLCQGTALSSRTCEQKTGIEAQEEEQAQEPTPNRECAAIVRVRAVRALGKIGRDSDVARFTVRGGLSDRHPLVRAESIKALGALGASSQGALLALMQSLDDPDPRVSDEADSLIRRLVEYWPGSHQESEQAISNLLHLWRDRLTETNEQKLFVYIAIIASYAATYAELECFVPAVLEAVSLAMHCPEREVTCTALFAIQQLGPKASSLARLVEDLLVKEGEGQGNAPGLEMRALWTLRSIGTGAVGSLPTLRRILSSGDRIMRLECAITMTHLLNPPPDEAIHVLRQMLTTDDEQLRQLARFRLGQIGMPLL